ncbi:unnamed protein product [Sympodiomycopsis kandeliae]
MFSVFAFAILTAILALSWILALAKPLEVDKNSISTNTVQRRDTFFADLYTNTGCTQGKLVVNNEEYDKLASTVTDNCINLTNLNIKGAVLHYGGDFYQYPDCKTKAPRPAKESCAHYGDANYIGSISFDSTH